MMILRSSPPSPFGRKIKLAMGILGLDSQVTIEKADPTDPGNSIRKQNPLGKIPALIVEDGTVLYNSPVILEYLDHRAGGGKILPQEPNARFAALTLQSLCDGILDACILLVYEGRWRPVEKHEPKWIDHQTGKVERAFACSRQTRRRSRRRRTSARSRSPARSAIRICVSAANGAAAIRAC